MASVSQIDLLGLNVDAVTEQDLVDHVLERVEERTGGFLCTVNLDILRQCAKDPSAAALVSTADIVVADGMPLIWASRLAGTPLPERVAGSSLIWSLPGSAAHRGASVFFLGGNEGSADAAARVISDQHPELRMAGTYCPPFGFEDRPEELAALEAAVIAADPDIVFVGLGFPKQEKLIVRLRPLLPDAWFINCGISFSFVSGEVVRAPRLVQRLGLEWVHRLLQEPRRLASRYLVHGLPFVAVLMQAAVRQRLGKRSASSPARSDTALERRRADVQHQRAGLERRRQHVARHQH